MNRIVGNRQAEAIGRAIKTIGRTWNLISDTQFWIADPVFSGLHSEDDTGDGRSYRNTAHTCYPFHIERPASERATTVVLPEYEDPCVIVHELGHALDYRLGFSHPSTPISEYGATNRYESFAEAFTGWFFDYGDQGALWSDQRTVRLFESLTGRDIHGGLV